MALVAGRVLTQGLFGQQAGLLVGGLLRGFIRLVKGQLGFQHGQVPEGFEVVRGQAQRPAIGRRGRLALEPRLARLALRQGFAHGCFGVELGRAASHSEQFGLG